ncbi:MAG: hypothetical protein ACC645_19025 [Pirellulales bacterium]
MAPTASAFDFFWSPTADTLDWFGIDNPVVGNSGWTLVGVGITTFVPDDPGDRAFIGSSGKTVTLNAPVTVGTVRLGFDAVNAILSLGGSASRSYRPGTSAVHWPRYRTPWETDSDPSRF